MKNNLVKRIATLESKMTVQNTPFIAVIDCAEGKYRLEEQTRLKNGVKRTTRDIYNLETYIKQSSGDMVIIIDDI